MNKKSRIETMRTGLTVVSTLVMSCTLSLSGCAAKKEVTDTLVAGSCTIVASGFTTCIDYTGAGFTGVSAQSACANSNSGATTGTYSTSVCTTTSRVGSCKIGSGQATEQTIRYMAGYVDATAQTACNGLSGTYTSG